MWDPCLCQQKKHLDNYHIFVSSTTWVFLYLLWWCSFQFRVVICFANFVKCKQGAYSQNGYNGLFSSDVYLGAAVVVWWISAFDATYSVIYQSKLLLQFFPVLLRSIAIHILEIFGMMNSQLSLLSSWVIVMLVVNLRNMSENKVVATFKIRSMGYLHSGKLQDCLRLSFQNSYTDPKAEIP